MKQRWNMGSKSNYILAVYTLSTLAVVGSGCGNFSGRAIQYRAQDSQWNSISSNTQFRTDFTQESSAMGYTCAVPLRYNVRPPASDVASPQNSYYVCAHRENTEDVLLVSESGDRELCAFPVQEFSNGASFVKTGADLISPLYQCAQTRAAQSAFATQMATFKFASTNYNALLIVKRADLESMVRCLMDPLVGATQMQSCPKYSYGLFRPNR